jgi:hypothetical protein
VVDFEIGLGFGSPVAFDSPSAAGAELVHRELIVVRSRLGGLDFAVAVKVLMQNRTVI